ncbi:TonB-dependent receptor [Fluviicola chungangensis]|uniref:TonB-dependent receptor n=1 Tax=Fluviicola chungangensis TaxID=2597671 RepID=A0A556N3F2_9FLAO|nr:TonB-dependent receptor [Fluviicola chungangensis]TSJ46746.1 TonB-dependent receptor [Fluviicola chungangensis]
MILRLNWFILSVPFLLISHQLHAQNCNGSISGKVIDEHDGSPLGLAVISIQGLKKTVQSDENGNYRLDSICNGDYILLVRHKECDPLRQKVTVKGETIVSFYPEQRIMDLESVTIQAQRLTSQSTQPKDQVSPEKLDQTKGLSLGDALKTVPGVNTLNTGNSISKPIIHGLHSNRILILNNEIRQEGQQWGIEHAPEIDPFIAGKLSVIKGANSVRYGSDAMGGVVLVDPRPLRDSAGINGEVNLIGATNGRGGTASAFFDGNFRKLPAFSWRVQGTLKQNGTLSTPKYNLINTGLKEYNFSYALGWKKQHYGAEVYYSQFNTTLGIFGASHIGNLTDLDKAFHSSVPLETGKFTYKIGRPYQHIEHELLKAKCYFDTGKRGKLTIIYSRQYNLRYEYDKHPPLNDSLAALNKPDLQFEITTHTTDVIWEHRTARHIAGSIGINGITQGNTYEGRALIPNFRNYSGGIFWIERWKKKHFELEAGARYDYKWLRIYKYEYIGNATYELISPIHHFENVTGNLGAIYKKDSSFNVSLNVSSAWRAPSVSELYSSGLHHGAAAIEYGNPALGSEIAYNAILAIRYQPSDQLFIEVSPYYNFIHNFIYRQPTEEPVLTIRGAFPGFNYVQTDAILKGCDFYANYKIFKRFELTGKASILRAWNKTQDNWLIMMPADRGELEAIYRFKSHGKIQKAYLSVSALYVNKQWRVPQNVDFAPPPPAYFLLGANASITVKIAQQDIEFGLSVQNALNQSYRDYLDRFRYFADQPGINVLGRIKIPFHFGFK